MLLLAGWLCFLSVLAPGSARAFALRVQPGVTCLDESELRHALAPLLSPAAAGSPADVEVLGSRHDPRTVLMRVHHPDGAVFERAFSPAPERCEHLHQAVALALALALKAVPPPLSPSERAAVSDKRLQSVTVGIGPVLGIGVAGGWAGGGELSGALVFRHAALRALVLAARASREEIGQGYYDSVLVAGRVDGCGRLSFTRKVHGELCAGLLLGQLFLQGGGLEDAQRQVLRQLGLTLDLGVGWDWEHGTGMRLGGTLVGMPEPLRVVVSTDVSEIVNKLPPVVGLFSLSIRYAFFARRAASAKVSAPSDMKE